MRPNAHNMHTQRIIFLFGYHFPSSTQATFRAVYVRVIGSELVFSKGSVRYDSFKRPLTVVKTEGKCSASAGTAH